MQSALVTYRVGETRDAAELAVFAERTFRQSHMFDANPVGLDAYVASHFGPLVQAAELADPASTFFFAEAGGELIGYVQQQLDNEPACTLVPAPRRFAEAKRVYVAQEWHGQGIAQQLLEHCFLAARAAGCDVVWLSVWKHNHRAIRFYEKAGLLICGESTFQLGREVQHDWVMAKRLS